MNVKPNLPKKPKNPVNIRRVSSIHSTFNSWHKGLERANPDALITAGVSMDDKLLNVPIDDAIELMLAWPNSTYNDTLVIINGKHITTNIKSNETVMIYKFLFQALATGQLYYAYVSFINSTLVKDRTIHIDKFSLEGKNYATLLNISFESALNIFLNFPLCDLYVMTLTHEQRLNLMLYISAGRYQQP